MVVRYATSRSGGDIGNPSGKPHQKQHQAWSFGRGFKTGFPADLPLGSRDGKHPLLFQGRPLGTLNRRFAAKGLMPLDYYLLPIMQQHLFLPAHRIAKTQES